MKETTTKIKSVSLPLDVFGKFRSTDIELAGEVFQYVLGYVIDGEQKHFTDPYKEMLFESLLEPIRPQMARYSERAEQCQEMARERAKTQKSTRKKNVKAAKGDEDVGLSYDSVTSSCGNITSTCDNVETATEDITFATFMSIYEHQDKSGFDTESVWNRLCDHDKREAIRYARIYVTDILEVSKREWPSRFLSNRLWTNNKNQ